MNKNKVKVYTISKRALLLINAGKGGMHLKATGIVRRIDDLGRVVIPEIRRTLRIRRRPTRNFHR